MRTRRLHPAPGDAEGALARCVPAETMALEMGLRPVAWQAQARAAEALAALGRASEADAKRRAARAIIQEIAASLQDRALGAQYLGHVLSSVT